MTVHELTRPECLDVLRRSHVGRLACARDSQPYIVPISFDFDGDDACLYSFSTVGQKIHWMRDNPKVAVEVDDIVDRFNWTTIVMSRFYDEPATSVRRREPKAERTSRRPAVTRPADRVSHAVSAVRHHRAIRQFCAAGGLRAASVDSSRRIVAGCRQRSCCPESAVWSGWCPSLAGAADPVW
ncbi:MAG: pyridoxamine 5'-phosphate oxidase family protein [Acidobacteria bacterium]|nr:pyridoxamine 5'-phosphate oxidase family protein [Acidobacteriota bacterium]